MIVDHKWVYLFDFEVLDVISSAEASEAIARRT